MRAGIDDGGLADMSGKMRMLTLMVLSLLVLGGAYLGWRHYQSAPDSTAVATEPVSRDTPKPADESPPADDSPEESIEPPASPAEAEIAPDRAAPSSVASPVSQTRGGRAPQNLNNLIADIKALHAACLERKACTEPKWWDVTVRLYAADAPVHLLELYAAVSRSWRAHLEAGPSADFDRELAIKLMNRAREWGH
jgi:hypothetical protein